MAAETGEELTHDEMWDDSDLVQNWNEAFAEYNKYHSLAARGEKVEKSATSSAQGPNGSAQKAHVPVTFTRPTATASASEAPQVAAQPATANLSAAPGAPLAVAGLASLPHSLLSTQDEALKNIMMSWYYAGYYTGLYEGQQKAWASMQETQQTG